MTQPQISSSVEAARELLERGVVVAVPTETVYGLAGLIDSTAAIRSIFELKGRPLYDPLIVHIGSRDQLSFLSPVDKWTASFRAIFNALTSAFWPGALTIVIPKLDSVDPLITAGLDTVGVRMPKHPVCVELLRSLGKPFAAPSANRFKRTSPTSSEHVCAEFENRDLFVLEGGPCEIGIESTVIQILNGQQIQLLRPGVITSGDLQRVLNTIPTVEKIEIVIQESGASPGSLAEHYMPEKPLVVLEGIDRKLSRTEKFSIAQALGLLSTAEMNALLKSDESADFEVREIQLSESALVSARDLYRQLHQFGRNTSENSIVLFLTVRKGSTQVGEVWEAVWNRLEKAATLKSFITA